ncbi:MAG: DUF4364 family protein [Ruminiclostridium sp.]|nr:DUF4364 family protein [Ruminiclostridium sp.]
MNYRVPKITLYENREIQILIAHILRKVGSMSKEELMRCTVDQDFVKYFDFHSCIMSMEEKKLITIETIDGCEICHPTNQSNYLAIELAYSIPLSVREDSVYHAKKITSHTHLEKSVKCEIIPLEQGYHLYIRFINEVGGADLMELKIYAPTLEAAQQMEKRFFANPAGAYRSVLNSFIQGYLTVSEAELKEAMEDD